MKTAIIALLIFSILPETKGQANKISIAHSEIQVLTQDVPGVSASTTFKKISEWIQYNYKNPRKVKKGKVENKFIRFTGVAKDATIYFGTSYDLEYTISINIKDDRYSLIVERLKFWNGGAGTEVRIKQFFKPYGEIKKVNKPFGCGIEDTLNRINASIYKYVTSEGQDI